MWYNSAEGVFGGSLFLVVCGSRSTRKRAHCHTKHGEVAGWSRPARVGGYFPLSSACFIGHFNSPCAIVPCEVCRFAFRLRLVL